MKILLTTLNSKYVHSNLALKLLYTCAAEKCEGLEIKEFTINQNDDYIFTELLQEEYDVICFSCYIWNIERIIDLAENIKKAQPDVWIVLGGPETSFETVEFIKKHKSIDFIITGEGEYTFSSLCRALKTCDERFEKIKGLVYRKDGKIYVNPPSELLIFESIPFPYDTMPCESDKVLYYESARGCPFSCSYCLSSLDKKIRALSLGRVFHDLDWFLEREVKQVKFVDRTFNWDKVRCNEIVKYIIEKDNAITNFHVEICGEFIDDEFLDLAARARKGLFQFEIGIQSTYKKTLAAVNRSDQIEKLLHNTRKLTALGNVKVHVDLIAGLPYESYHTFQNSFNDVYSLGADTFQLGFLKLLKGTEIREKIELYRYEYRRKAPYEVISNRFISAKDITRLKQIEELLDLYDNRGGFEKTLGAIIENLAESAFAFYEEFSIFYSLKGFQHRSHKKEDLYRILYEYINWKCKTTEITPEAFITLLSEDLQRTMNQDAVKKFERKGWNIL